MYPWGICRSVLLVGVYIDDLVITDAEEAEIEAFKAQMKATFQMSDFGHYFYLGVEVRQDDTGITLHQAHYAKHIMEFGGLDGCNSAHILMGGSS